MAIQLNGTIANWQQHKSALESSLYELGVGHLLDMTDDQVPPTPDAIGPTNAAAVGFATRLLSDHRDKDMKGYGYMTKCMDPGTRQMVLDKSGTAAAVADAAQPEKTVLKGSIRSLWAAYGTLMQQPANRRTQHRNLLAVMSGSTKPQPRWLDGGRSPVVEVAELVNKNNMIEAGMKMSNDALMVVILSKLPPCMRSFYDHHIRTPQSYAVFYNQLVEECDQYKWHAVSDVEHHGEAAYHADYPDDTWYDPPAPNPYAPTWHPCGEDWPESVHGAHGAMVPYAGGSDPAHAHRDCYNCGQKGHISSACPDLGRRVMGQAVPYHAGYGRGRPGHGARASNPPRPGGKGTTWKGKGGKGKGGSKGAQVHAVEQVPADYEEGWYWYSPGQFPVLHADEPRTVNTAELAGGHNALAAFTPDQLRAEVRRQQEAAAAASAADHDGFMAEVSIVDLSDNHSINFMNDAHPKPAVISAGLGHCTGIATTAKEGAAGNMGLLGSLIPAPSQFSAWNFLIVSLMAVGLIFVGLSLYLMVAAPADVPPLSTLDPIAITCAGQVDMACWQPMPQHSDIMRHKISCRDYWDGGCMLGDGDGVDSLTSYLGVPNVLESHCDSNLPIQGYLAAKFALPMSKFEDYASVGGSLEARVGMDVSEVGCDDGVTPLSSIANFSDLGDHPTCLQEVYPTNLGLMSSKVNLVDDWYMLDSGASCTTLKHPSLSHMDAVPKVIKIGTASGVAKPLLNTTSGYSSFRDANGSVVHFGSSRVYGGVKGCPKNLLSVIDYAKAGGRVHFEDFGGGEYCRAWSNDGDLLEVLMHNNLPYLKLTQVEAVMATHMQEAEFPSTSMQSRKKPKGVTLSFLHWVLAHSDVQMLKVLPQYVDGIELVADHGEFRCHGHGCQLGKAKHVPFPRNTQPKTLEVGAEISADYKSSKVPSILRKYTGFFLHKDRASRFRFIFCSRTKTSKTQLHAFKQFAAFMFKNNHYVRHINFDGGGEFVAQEMLDYLGSQFIDYTFTNTDTPQQNSIAERDIQTVSDKSDAQLQGMQAPDQFWDLSSIHVVGIDNCLIESRHPTFPPLEWVTGSRVSMARYQLPWFCVVFCLRTDRLKGESRKARPGLFVGFPQHQRGIMAYIPALHRLVATVNFTYDLTITTKTQRAGIDWHGDSNYLGSEEVCDEVWESQGEYEDVHPHQHVDVTTRSPADTPRRAPPPAHTDPILPNDPSPTVLDFDEYTSAPGGVPVPNALPRLGIPTQLLSQPDFDGGHFRVQADGGMVTDANGIRHSARFSGMAEVLDSIHVDVVVDGCNESAHFNMSDSIKGSWQDEQQHQADVAYHSVHQHVYDKVLAQGDMEVHPSVQSVDLYNSFMVHLTQHSALPPPSKLPNLSGTMSSTLRSVIGKEPKGVHRAVSCPLFGAYWREAMNKECASLVENGTYSLRRVDEVEQLKQQDPENVSLMWTHFINCVKTMDDGGGNLVVDKFKSRLVVEGNWMTRLIDYTSSYSPVVSMDTLKVLLCLAVCFSMELTSLDFVTAFLQASVDGDHVYAYLPKGYEMHDEEGNLLCMHLHKNLYGMVQASRMFFLMVSAWLLNPLPLDQGGCGMVWTQLVSDQCVFYTQEGSHLCFLLLYVDDGAIMSTCSLLRAKVLKHIQARFKVEDKGPLSNFLGLMVEHCKDKGTVTLSMKATIMDKITQFGLQDAHPPLTAMKQKQKPSKDDDGLLSASDITTYRSMVGCLIWFMSVRPDIMEATSHCTPNMQAPTNKDMSMVKRVYAYLLGTIDKLLTFSQEGMWVEMDMGIPYKTSKQAWSMVAGYVDANLGRPYSYTGLCYKMGGGCVIARTKKQPVPAIQTYDSELYGWSLACCAGIWLWMLLMEVNHLFDHQLLSGPIVCHGDNASVVRTVQEQAMSTKARHIALRWYHFMHAMKHKVLEAHHISGKCNPANCLSKPPESNQGFMDEADDLLGLRWLDKWNGKEKPSGW